MMKVPLSIGIVIILSSIMIVNGNWLIDISNLSSVFSRIMDQSNKEKIFEDENVLHSYINKFGLDRTMKELSIMSEELGSCHNIAHKAGQIAYEISGESAFDGCNEYCQSGCYHGAIGAFFRERGTDNLAQNLEKVCRNVPNDFVRFQCLHGVGHGLMAWADYKLPEALRSCELLPKNAYFCWLGVFMENIMGGVSPEEVKNDPRGVEAHVTEYLSNDPLYPCNIVEEKYKKACYFMQTTRMTKLFSRDFSEVAETCLKAPQEYQRDCFESMGRDIGETPQKDPQEAIRLCSLSPYGEARTACLIGVVGDAFWDSASQGAAINFCKFLSDDAEKVSCYQRIIARASIVLGDNEEFSEFCENIEKSYKTDCRN